MPAAKLPSCGIRGVFFLVMPCDSTGLACGLWRPTPNTKTRRTKSEIAVFTLVAGSIFCCMCVVFVVLPFVHQ